MPESNSAQEVEIKIFSEIEVLQVQLRQGFGDEKSKVVLLRPINPSFFIVPMTDVNVKGTAKENKMC